MYPSKLNNQYNGATGTPSSSSRNHVGVGAANSRTETEHPRIPLPTSITAFHPFDTHRLDTIVSACPQIALETNCNLELWDTRTDASRVYSQLQIVGYRKRDIQKARKAIGDVALRAEEEIMAAYRQRDQNVRKVEPVARYFYYMSREARETILGRNNERLAGIVASAKCSIVEPVVVRVNDENPPIFIGGSIDAVKKAKKLLDEQVESYRDADTRNQNRETRKRTNKNRQSPERSAMLSSSSRRRSSPKSNNQPFSMPDIPAYDSFPHGKLTPNSPAGHALFGKRPTPFSKISDACMGPRLRREPSPDFSPSPPNGTRVADDVSDDDDDDDDLRIVYEGPTCVSASSEKSASKKVGKREEKQEPDWSKHSPDFEPERRSPIPYHLERDTTPTYHYLSDLDLGKMARSCSVRRERHLDDSDFVHKSVRDSLIGPKRGEKRKSSASKRSEDHKKKNRGFRAEVKEEVMDDQDDDAVRRFH